MLQGGFALFRTENHVARSERFVLMPRKPKGFQFCFRELPPFAYSIAHGDNQKPTTGCGLLTCPACIYIKGFLGTVYFDLTTRRFDKDLRRFTLATEEPMSSRYDHWKEGLQDYASFVKDKDYHPV